MELPENLKKIATNLDARQLPDVFLGELQEFNWALEECIFANGRGGVRLILMPALLPFIKFSLPFHITGLAKLRDDLTSKLIEVGWDEPNEPSQEN